MNVAGNKSADSFDIPHYPTSQYGQHLSKFSQPFSYNLRKMNSQQNIPSKKAVRIIPIYYDHYNSNVVNNIPKIYNANYNPQIHKPPNIKEASVEEREKSSYESDDNEDAIEYYECEQKRISALAERAFDHDTDNLPPPDAPETSSESSFDDQELVDQLEREQIVEKYEKGPDQADVDPWENPNFELYRTTDRYGFVHKDERLLEEENKKKRIEREMIREKKWVQMLDEWKKRHPVKMPERIWKGVPDKLRLIIWQKLLNVVEMKSKHKENLYHELLARARLVSKDVKQIDLDINRTYRDNLAFRRRYDIKQKSLFNVLTAYAMMNTEVGYCQGMSQIAAVFLMYMDEEDAFWCMHSLLISPKYTMHGFFVPGFPKLKRFQDHYERVIAKYLPRLKKHLDKACIPPIYLTKWWFGCFLDRVPFSLALRVWDVFLYYGDSILIAMALNIMAIHRKTILRLQIENFMEFIQQRLAENFGFTDDKVMNSLKEWLKRLQNDLMALPPPPKTGTLAEIPTKPFGPILTRSLMDLQSEIAEIHSRCSRSNSLCGKSPLVRRHQRKHQTPLITHQTTKKLSASEIDHSRGSNQQPHNISPSNNNIPSSSFASHFSDQAFRRTGSTKDRVRPPPVPDADGFIPISALPRRTHQKNSFDGSPMSSPAANRHSVKGQKGPGVQQRFFNNDIPQHSYNSSVDTGSTISRVQRGPNNVTLISIGMESGNNFSSPQQQKPRQPTPPPDYNNDSDEELFHNHKQQGNIYYNKEKARKGITTDYGAGGTNAEGDRTRPIIRHVYEPQPTFIRKF